MKKDKFELFKERVQFLNDFCESVLIAYKTKVAETPLYSLTYEIKWGFEDLVRQEYMLKKYTEILEAIKANEDWKENILEWLEEDLVRNQSQINRLGIMNSSGMMHNTFGIFELKAQAHWMEELESLIKLLKREEDN